MQVGYFQFRPLFGKPGQNCKKIVAAINDVDADLLVLPELALSGYYFADRAETIHYAEDPANSPRLDTLCELMHQKQMHMVIGFSEKQDEQCFNSAALIGPNGIEHIYRKIHLFNEEKFCFDDGNIPFTVNTIKGARIGIMICFDWAFPEAMRTLAVRGAQLICQPANLVLTFCQETMFARSIENRVFIITANRYGEDKRPQGTLMFTGKSQLVAPGGRLIRRAVSQRDEIYVADIDPSLADNKKITEHNDLFLDRRPELYI